jgi:hypothetical protein
MVTSPTTTGPSSPQAAATPFSLAARLRPTAHITNNGGISVEGGSTGFAEMSSAGNGVFTNNGGAVGGAVGGYTIFTDRSIAANATLIANGSPNGGEGGSIWFFDKSRGGTARVELFGNGNLDISAYLAPRGVTIGSIEGDGDVFLGAMNLSVGSNSLSTVFSGVIQDGGIAGGTGGSLTKIGTGKLVLRHRNTYNWRNYGQARQTDS